MKAHRPYELQEYNPAWKSRFLVVAEKLKPIFGDNLVEIVHVGSTSIEGMVAKPQIDVLAVVKNIDLVKESSVAFSKAGFTLQGRGYVAADDEYITEDSLDGKRLTSIHTLQFGNPRIFEFKAFKDYLTANKEDRDLYIATKRELYFSHHNNYAEYDSGKSDIIDTINARAKQWATKKAVNFIYDEDKDIDCLLAYGPGSNNQPNQKTKTYEELSAYTKDVLDRKKVREFVRAYIKENKINIEENLVSVQKNWDLVNDEFKGRAEKVFGLSLKDDISAYLTITGRFPYDFRKKYFYVSAKKTNTNKTAVHELWHFYTYYKFGYTIEQIGPKKFNDLKESSTVLLNVECQDLMGGEVDVGYPQHESLRKVISEAWQKTHSIDEVWRIAQEALS